MLVGCKACTPELLCRAREDIAAVSAPDLNPISTTASQHSIQREVKSQTVGAIVANIRKVRKPSKA